MLICPQCQKANSTENKFCERCGEELSATVSPTTVSSTTVSSATVPATANLRRVVLVPPGQLTLSPAIFLGSHDSNNKDSSSGKENAIENAVENAVEKSRDRYQVLTVLSPSTALVEDTLPGVRSPQQNKLAELYNLSADDIQEQIAHSALDLPSAAYPYLLLTESTPTLYDAWQQDKTTVLITLTEQVSLTPLIEAFSAAVDPLRYVYWMYGLTNLWRALEPAPEWRYSLLLANNLGIDDEHSLRVKQFALPPQSQADSQTDSQSESSASSAPQRPQPPQLGDLKAFLQSLLARPHIGKMPPLPQISKTIHAVSAAQTLDELRYELAAIGESLLATPEAITPSVVFTDAKISAVPGNLKASGPAVPALNLANTPVDTPVDEASNMSAQTPSAQTPSSQTPSENPPVNNADNSADEQDLLTPSSVDAAVDTLEVPDFTDSGDATVALPMVLTALQDAGRTDVGRQRDHNEDCFFIASSTQKRADNNGDRTQAHCLYVLCDGMGGHDGGEVASQLAAHTLKTYFDEKWPHPLPGQPPSPLPSEAIFTEGVKLANQAIFDINEKEGRAGHARMGTTLVVVLLQGTEAVVAHVGDSRLYQYARRGGLTQVTTDHEVGQREIKRGVPHALAYARPDAYQLTQALGPRGSDNLQPSVSYLNFSEDTLLLLCSDGLSDNNLVEDYLTSHIEPMLKGEKGLDAGMDELIELGNEVNGHDNISAIAVRIEVSPDMAMGHNPRTADAGQTRLQ